MSRNRRANSDLYGLKSTKNNKSYSFKQSESTISNHKLESYQPKSALSRKVNCPETPIKKTDSQQLILDTYRLIKHYYQNDDVEFCNRVKKYVNGELESHKKNFNQHLNKLMYIQGEMQKKNYKEIELEIVGEWRKNPLLHCIRAFWYQYVGAIKYNYIGDFQKKYNLFRDLIGQLAYLYFRRFFVSLGSQTQIQKVLDKLTQRTSHLIITYTSTWCKVCDKVVMPLLKSKFISQSIADFDVTKFNLQSLGMKTIAVDYTAQQVQMPKTIDSIQKFVIEHKILEKIQLLLDIRKNMQKQIMKRQKNLVQKGQLKQIKVLDKDDFVDCLIYCIVKSDISLEKLGLSIKFFYYMLAADAEIILSTFRCDPYLADLEAVYDFLSQEAEKNSKQPQNKNNLQISNSTNYTTSQTLINSTTSNF